MGRGVSEGPAADDRPRASDAVVRSGDSRGSLRPARALAPRRRRRPHRARALPANRRSGAFPDRIHPGERAGGWRADRRTHRRNDDDAGGHRRDGGRAAAVACHTGASPDLMEPMTPNPFDTDHGTTLDVPTRAAGPIGVLPLTAEMLRNRPSGDLFGWTQNAGMGWDPAKLGAREFLMLSTHGGIRAADGTPIALGYHTGHWEVGLLMEAAAAEFSAAGMIPFAASCTDPCDGRSQGTPAMFDSLPYRNDAATIFRRLIRSLPTRRGVLGIATCDKGLPAMMMALAATHDLPCVLVPGGVTLLPIEAEDAGRVQSIGVRFVHGDSTLEQAADLGCRACASPGGGCQFLGTAATSQVVGEALGLSLCP